MIRTYALFVCLSVSLAGFSGLLSGAEEKVSLPNILLIYADDLGYGDVQCYNTRRGKIATPHIDRLATEGMRFTDAHSSSGVCSPSRYTILTGRYHWRSRLQSGIVGLWKEPLISAERMTIGSLAQSHGYRTACIGKWHLGWNWPIPQSAREYFRAGKEKDVFATEGHREAWQGVFSKPIDGGPITRGFDEYFGTDVPNWPPFCFIQQDRTIGIPTEFLPARLFQNHQASVQGPALLDWSLEPILPALGDRVAQFILDEAKKPSPFLVYMPLTSPHTPLSVNDAWKGKSGLGAYADLVMETDAVVGQVLNALEKSGAAKETLVIFTSDNGCAPYIGVSDLEAKGHYPSGPLRGYKSDVWEGGHRVPLIIRWPGVVQQDAVCGQLVHQADLIKTFADVMRSELPEDAGEDSFSLLPLLNDTGRSIRDHAVSCSMRGLPSIRQGDWKLVLGQGSGGWTQGSDEHPVQLYDLGNDLGETSNLAAKHPERVAAMQTLMETLISKGRSTAGQPQRNDVQVRRYPR